MSVHAVAFFCEDIRQEKGGQVTLVGVLPDTIQFPKTPALFPKLGVYLRCHFTASEKPKAISAKFVGANSSQFKELSWNEEAINVAFSAMAANEVTFAGFMGRAVRGPFKIMETGFLRVVVVVDGKEHQAGGLNFKELSPTASEQPAAQSETASAGS
jgi:hypothetical protein